MLPRELTQPRPEHVGLVIAELYAIAMFLLLGFTWYNARPENHGMDWLG
jgi:hypothetical protein